MSGCRAELIRKSEPESAVPFPPSADPVPPSFIRPAVVHLSHRRSSVPPSFIRPTLFIRPIPALAHPPQHPAPPVGTSVPALSLRRRDAGSAQTAVRLYGAASPSRYSNRLCATPRARIHASICSALKSRKLAVPRSRCPPGHKLRKTGTSASLRSPESDCRPTFISFRSFAAPVSPGLCKPNEITVETITVETIMTRGTPEVAADR
jgi:hypothetical protein